MAAKDTLLIGDQVKFSFKAQVPKGAKLVFTKPDSTVNGLEIVGIPHFDTLSSNAQMTEIQTNFSVTSFDSGSHYLPKLPALIQKSDGSIDTVWSNEANLEYKTIQIDTTTYKPYDVKGQMEYPVTLKEILCWAGIVLLAAALVFLVIRYLKRRKLRKGLFEKPRKDDPPHVTALRDLEKIKEQALWQNNKEKLYYTYITDVLRVYIEARFNFATMERTSAEIMTELAGSGVDKKSYDTLNELLKVADLVKFAKYKATAEENESAIPAAIKFVTGTILEEPTKENKE